MWSRSCLWISGKYYHVYITILNCPNTIYRVPQNALSLRREVSHYGWRWCTSTDFSFSEFIARSPYVFADLKLGLRLTMQSRCCLACPKNVIACTSPSSNVPTPYIAFRKTPSRRDAGLVDYGWYRCISLFRIYRSFSSRLWFDFSTSANQYLVPNVSRSWNGSP